MKIEKVEFYKVNGLFFKEERSAEMYLSGYQLEQALADDDKLDWRENNPTDIVDWIKENKEGVLDYLEVIGG